MGYFLLSKILFFILLFCTPCLAQVQVEKYGVKFEVDNVVSTGAGQSVVKIGNTEQLISNIRIPAFVINEYLSSEKLFQKLSLQQIGLIIEGASKEQDLELIKTALSAVLRYSSDHTVGLKDFFLILNSVTQSGQILFELLSLNTTSQLNYSPSAIGMALSFLAVNYPNLIVHQDLAQLLSEYRRQIRVNLRIDFFEALRNGDNQEAQKVINGLIAIFGDSDQEIAGLNSLLSKMASVDTQAGFADLIIELASQDPEVAKSIGSVAVELIHDKIRNLLEARLTVNALQELSKIDISKRTPKTHSLVNSAFLNLTYDDFIILFSDNNVRNFIEFITRKDQNLKESFIKTLEEQITKVIADGMFSDKLLDAGFGLLADVRPEPNQLTDKFRLTLIEIAQKQNDYLAVKYLTNNIKSELSVFDEFRLFWSWFSSKIFFIVISVILLIGSFFVIYGRTKKVFKFWKEKKKQEIFEPEDLSQRPLFVKGRPSASKYPSEYINLLDEFRLAPEASLKQIKVAYRNKIKDIHPDVSNKKSDKEQFIKYKDIYERILDFRKRLKLDIDLQDS